MLLVVFVGLGFRGFATYLQILSPLNPGSFSLSGDMDYVVEEWMPRDILVVVFYNFATSFGVFSRH